MALTIDNSATSFASFSGMGSLVNDSIAPKANAALSGLNDAIKVTQQFQQNPKFAVENATPQGKVELASEARTEAAMAAGTVRQ
jgi:hypothetical protein